MTDPTNPGDDQGDEPLDDIDAEAVEDLDVDEDAEAVKGGPWVTDPTCGPECRTS
jgi:hypothetical protein